MYKSSEIKKLKRIEASISNHRLPETNIYVLRYPADKIFSNAESEIIELQQLLDLALGKYKNGEKADLEKIPGLLDDIAIFDPRWTLRYYKAEYAEYVKHNANLVNKQTAIQANIKNDDTDSQPLVARTAGYHFVSKSFVLAKEKPTSKSQNFGKLYTGTYVKIIDSSAGNGYVRVLVADNFKGFVLRTDLVNELDLVDASAEALARFKSAHYYNFEETNAYLNRSGAVSTMEQETGSQKPDGNYNNGAQQTGFGKAGNEKTYYTGPDGRCFYLSRGKKVYVDKKVCPL